MGTCCTTRDKGSLDDSTTKYLDQNTKNDIQRSLVHIRNYLEKNPDVQILTLCYSKDQLGNFVTILSQIMTIIKTKTQQIFVPISLQNSPFNPEHEMLIVMSSIDKLDKFSIDQEQILDESRLAKQFFIKPFQFMDSDPTNRSNQLKNDLINFYKNEGYMIVGGVQDPGKVNKVQLLFYKTDQNRIGGQGPNSSYDIQVKHAPEQTDSQGFDFMINQAQMDNQQLRTVISFEDTYSRFHFIILQTTNIDRLYILSNFPKQICDDNQTLRDSMSGINKSQASLQSLTQTQPASGNTTMTNVVLDPFTVRQNLAEKMSLHLNAQERKLQSSIIELIVNGNYRDSYIVSTM